MESGRTWCFLTFCTITVVFLAFFLQKLLNYIDFRDSDCTECFFVWLTGLWTRQHPIQL